ncbi:hypothetical protein CBM2637_A30029 [Cupriavidus taiwanensis]|nr:hypothetical protein CBM2637_A30029 [Cupriavidus taiwanensis]
MRGARLTIEQMRSNVRTRSF